MKILNFGSLNIDLVYQVDHFVQPGETLASNSFTDHFGGKGFNQSIALAKAGAQVYHGGKIGQDGQPLKEYLQQNNANTNFIFNSAKPTGHAIIQVDSKGENAIIISGGANQDISEEDIDETLRFFSKSDWLLLQNEISKTDIIIEKAQEIGMNICFNPAPFTPEIINYPLKYVDYFFLNETEMMALGQGDNFSQSLVSLKKHYNNSAIIATQGSNGATYIDKENRIHVNAFKVTPVDTTAAGDTFIGYFLASFTEKNDIERALKIGSMAASIAVTRPGAATSIPKKEEVEKNI